MAVDNQNERMINLLVDNEMPVTPIILRAAQKILETPKSDDMGISVYEAQIEKAQRIYNCLQEQYDKINNFKKL